MKNNTNHCLWCGNPIITDPRSTQISLDRELTFCNSTHQGLYINNQLRKQQEDIEESLRDYENE